MSRWPGRALAYRWLVVLAVLVFISDQASKAWIASRIPMGTAPESPGAISVIGGFFYLVHVGNTGAAWSVFMGKSVMLAILAAATLLAIFVWRKPLGLHSVETQVCFGLLCGGISGNLFDRLHHGYVVDFVDLHFGNYIYPTFNVADAGICVGVVIYLFQSLRSPDR